MSQLGIPASVVINMLYKQIIMTKSIPFSLSISGTPITRDELDDAAFDAMMLAGLDEAKAGRSQPASEVLAALKSEFA